MPFNMALFLLSIPHPEFLNEHIMQHGGVAVAWEVHNDVAGDVFVAVGDVKLEEGAHCELLLQGLTRAKVHHVHEYLSKEGR